KEGETTKQQYHITQQKIFFFTYVLGGVCGPPKKTTRQPFNLQPPMIAHLQLHLKKPCIRLPLLLEMEVL
ncbi:MAG: hypothetical protein OXC03_05845, partial [Flavobacteriaceae bacterium]|nr:hypothetical protein [Flavobacteriaceae bacterium]